MPSQLPARGIILRSKSKSTLRLLRFEAKRWTLAAHVPHLVSEGLVILQAVGLIANEQIAGVLALESLGVKPERLIGDNQDLNKPCRNDFTSPEQPE